MLVEGKEFEEGDRANDDVDEDKESPLIEPKVSAKHDNQRNNAESNPSQD